MFFVNLIGVVYFVSAIELATLDGGQLMTSSQGMLIKYIIQIKPQTTVTGPTHIAVYAARICRLLMISVLYHTEDRIGIDIRTLLSIFRPRPIRGV